MEHLLSFLIFFPALCAIVCVFLNDTRARLFGLVASGLELVACIVLYVSVDTSFSGYPFVEKFEIIPSLGISYFIGVDGISLFLVFLSALIGFIGILFLRNEERLKQFVICILSLQAIVIGLFCALDMILFYIFWELSLVPMLYIIGIWGSENRIYASVKFFLYTFGASLIMLVGILYYAYEFHAHSGFWSFSLRDWYLFNLNVDSQKWLFWAFFIGIAVKVPMFPFHTWLPYAHGQAPTIGSVILASVFLKMGTYAFVRISLPLFPVACVDYQNIVAILCLCMIVYGAMLAYAQKDLKQVIAYSSISHMGVIVLGTFALNSEGISGSVFFMLGHGIVSAALFMLVGMLYERRHTKLISEFGGLMSVTPKIGIFFAIALVASVGLPLSIGFVGEFLSLYGYFQVSPLIAFIAGFSIILGAVYMLSSFGKVFLGELKNEKNKNLPDMNKREFFSLLPLIALIIALGIYPKPILEPISNASIILLDVMQAKLEPHNEIPHDELIIGE